MRLNREVIWDVEIKYFNASIMNNIVVPDIYNKLEELFKHCTDNIYN